MPESDIVPTQSAFLELTEERSGMQEGYDFLDEKRLILAAEMLDQLDRYEREMDAFTQSYATAAAALRAAVARHGLEGLALHPAANPYERLRVDSRSVLGVSVQTAVLEPTRTKPAEAATSSSPEANACRNAFADLIPLIAQAAVLASNLERLRQEYTRTARRARALEDVLLPEIDNKLRIIEAALEELEREEAVRVRYLCGNP